MTARLSFDQILENKLTTRMAREDKALDKLEKREAYAETMIGELTREGKRVCYVFPVGGKYREGSRRELIAFLLRRNYA